MNANNFTPIFPKFIFYWLSSTQQFTKSVHEGQTCHWMKKFEIKYSADITSSEKSLRRHSFTFLYSTWWCYDIATHVYTQSLIHATWKISQRNLKSSLTWTISPYKPPAAVNVMWQTKGVFSSFGRCSSIWYVVPRFP